MYATCLRMWSSWSDEVPELPPALPGPCAKDIVISCRVYVAGGEIEDPKVVIGRSFS